MEPVKSVALSDETLVTKQPDACYHCGELCGHDAVVADDRDFCCQGCSTVYQIITQNGLDDFYTLAEKPGFSLSNSSKLDYSWLDDPETQEQLITFRQGSTVRVLFELPQIHCASCVWLLEKLYRLNDGIQQSRVNFNRRELSVVFQEDQITFRELVELLDHIGYRPAIRLADLDKEHTPAVNRRLIYQLGVAGFAFGNIMLFSFPEYLGLNSIRESLFSRYFGYLNLALAMPVFLFSATDYFRSALAGIRVREINMDVPISLGILALFIRSTVEVLTYTGPGYFDSMAGLVFFLLIGKWFQQKSFDRLSFERDYKSYFPVSATLEDGTTRSLNQLIPGDRILVRNQELIPADGVLLEGAAMIDYSFVSGESAPVAIQPGSKVFAGGRQTGGRLLIHLSHTVKQSYLTQLWNEQSFHSDEKGRASKIARVMGGHFTWIVLSLALGTLAYWLAVDSGKAIHAFSSVLIIACPCALALAVPFIMGNGVRILGRNGAYVRGPQVIESLATTDVLVLDKTGTITYADQSDIQWEGDTLTEEEKWAVSAICRQSIHPLSQSLSAFLGVPPRSVQVTAFEEIPGQGLKASVNGKAYAIGRFGTPDTPPKRDVTAVEIHIHNGYVGSYIFQPRYRQGLQTALAAMPASMTMHLVSGDRPVDHEFLANLVGSPDQLHFQQLPADKLEFVKQQQLENHHVLMIGDGLNDAGALRQSNVGVVITESLNNFTPASDMILSAQSFILLPAIRKLSKRLVSHVYLAYGLALLYNVVGLSFAIRGDLSPIIAAVLMPLSSLSIVIYAWIVSHFESKRLGLIIHDHDQ
ncbi:MAG: heavy metal translocating P-type ATPase metal-binding domain-containing protein [Saprospiraceae bacterium]|nr:heavy metal translocating P-type ATPase metal-binding domain-containing protein [Saprospiraceae bacterium]